jgi:hypothetical protein
MDGNSCELMEAIIYGRPGSVVRLSIPIHGNKPLKTGLLAHLLKIGGPERY